jgi:hypothetical protein
MFTPVYRRLSLSVVLIAMLALAVAACGGTPTATPVPPTATPVPPTATLVPPTATPVPPTATSVPPTATTVPPTATLDPPTATKAATTAGTASAGDRELVGMAFASLGKATSFGMTVTVEGASESIPFQGDIIMEVVQSPTRTMRIKLSDQMDMIIAGQDTYLKLGAAAWQKSPMAPAQIEQLESSLDFSSAIKLEDLAKMEINKIGSEKVGTEDCDVFSIVVTTPAPQTSKMWVSKATKLPVKEYVEEATSKITILFFGWNKIKIDVPILP